MFGINISKLSKGKGHRLPTKLIVAVMLLQCCALAVAGESVSPLEQGHPQYPQGHLPSRLLRGPTEEQLPAASHTTGFMAETSTEKGEAVDGKPIQIPPLGGDVSYELPSRRLLQFLPTTEGNGTTSEITELPNAHIAFPYRNELNVNFTYSLIDGLPNGLQLSNSSIRGIPKVSGNFTIKLSATSKGKTTNQTYNLLVKSAEVVPFGSINMSINVQNTVDLVKRGGFPPVKLTLLNGPPFCALREQTLYCTPVSVGQFTLKFQLVDRLNNTSQNSITLSAVDPNSTNNSKPEPIPRVLPSQPDLIVRNDCSSTKKKQTAWAQITEVSSKDGNEEWTLKNGKILVVQKCTTKSFGPNVKNQVFDKGSRILYGGVRDPNGKPKQYLALHIVKVFDK